MKMRKAFIISCTVASLFFLYTSLTYAQQGESGKQKEKLDESMSPDDSYLARFHAIRIVDRLIEDNLNDIYMLKVIVSNFSDKGWNGDYQKVYDGYKTAMEEYYKRDLIQSRVSFETNREDIKMLMKKVIDEYKKEATQMLDECASKVLVLHLDATTRSDPDKNESLFMNQMRLRIAYSQFDDALIAERDHYYKGSIFHLRVAKSYAIKILEELSNPDERKKINDTYRKHKADNMNRILGGGGVQPQQTAK